MPVPLLDVNAQNLPLEEECRAAFERVFRSGRFILGEELEAFEAEVAEFSGTRHAIGVSSGTDAILLALMALGIGPGDEVLCPAFTFFATAGCVARLGATPVFVDSCAGCFQLDVADARRKITPRTKVLLPVHLFGQSAAMEGVLELAREYGLPVIEDAAQSLGAEFDGRPCGSMGDFGTFSFFPSKNLGGFGDAGMLVTNDDSLAGRARILRVHGSQPKYFHHFTGGNFRMDPLQAALLRVKLRHFQDYNARRRQNAAFYLGALCHLDAACGCSGVCLAPQGSCVPDLGSGPLVLPREWNRCRHIWNQFTLRVRDGRRDALRDHLLAAGIGCEIYYPLTMDQQPCFAGLPEASRSGLETAHRLASEVLSIPVYPELTAAQKSEVVEQILGFFASQPA